VRALIVLMSGKSWDAVPGTERRLADALCRHADLLWVDPPVSPVTPRRYRSFASATPTLRPRFQQVATGVHRLTPVVLPGLSRPVVRAATWPLVRRQAAAAVRKLGTTPTAVLSCSLDDVLRGWPADTRTVLYGTDDWVAGAELLGQSADRLAAQERDRVRAADLVLTVTPALAARWRGLGAEPVVLPNGCEPDAYRGVDSAPPAVLPTSLPTPIAGVVGQLNDRIDVALLRAVADSGIGLLLVGPLQTSGPAWTELLKHRNVFHPGAVAFDELPRWLCRMSVGLTPYLDTAFNRASFPLKTLEYLAAGRPVVGSDLPATRDLAAECADVHAVADPAAFVSTVHRVAGAPVDQQRVAARRAVAHRHSWSARADQLADLLHLRTAVLRGAE
jgi:teichuronic acid biosynthesis glycosyltransferase TuaH